MLRLMIVDDEYLIRQYIRNCINWEEIGYTIVGELGSAQGALRLAEELKPDVVLTDICMPGLDGLSFAGLLKDLNPNVRLIAITGYNDFEYAQRGIRVGLDNYLLKPIDENELRKVMIEVRESILSWKTQESLFSELSDYRRQNEPIVREYYLQKLLEPDFPSELRDEKIIDSILPGSGNFFEVLVLSFDDFSALLSGNEVKKGNREWIEKYLEEHFRNKSITWVSDKFGHLVLFCRERDCLWDKFLSELENDWRKNFHFGIYYGRGTPEHSWEDIYKSYMYANKQLNAAVAFGNNQYWKEKKYFTFKECADLLSMEDLKRLYTYIETDSPEKIEMLIKGWFQEWNNIRMPDLFYLKIQLLNAVFYIYSRGENKEDSVSFQKKYKDYYQQIVQIPTLKLLQEYFLEICGTIMKTFRSQNSVRPSTLIFSVKEYIDSHLEDTDLSLGKTAEKFYLNSSYLSRIFKQEAGISFIEYVNSQRVEKIKFLLLNTDLKIYEIAERVGIENANYLGIILKKMVGCSPYEYRSQKMKID